MAVWSEAREVLEPMVERVFAGDPVSIEDFSLGLNRQGHERPTSSLPTRRREAKTARSRDCSVLV
jgi:hypothetical protein